MMVASSNPGAGSSEHRVPLEINDCDSPRVTIRTDIWTDPRLVQLAARLRKPHELIVGHLVRLHMAVAQHGVDGRLVGWSAEVVVALSGWRSRKVCWTSALLETGWLELEDDGCLRVPDRDRCAVPLDAAPVVEASRRAPSETPEAIRQRASRAARAAGTAPAACCDSERDMSQPAPSSSSELNSKKEEKKAPRDTSRTTSQPPPRTGTAEHPLTVIEHQRLLSTFDEPLSFEELCEMPGRAGHSIGAEWSFPELDGETRDTRDCVGAESLRYWLGNNPTGRRRCAWPDLVEKVHRQLGEAARRDPKRKPRGSTSTTTPAAKPAPPPQPDEPRPPDLEPDEGRALMEAAARGVPGALDHAKALNRLAQVSA